MIISSRTPEGRPNRCPVCRAAVCVQPSEPPGDATCPHCGALLWFGNELVAQVTVVEFGDRLFDETARREFCERVTQLAEAGGLELLVDLSDLRFVSNSVLGVLLQLKWLVDTKGGQVAVCGLTPGLAQLFEISRLDRLLRIFRDQDDAMRHWFDD